MRHYTMQVFDRQKVQCSHITHSGRQSGIEEARGKQIIGRSLQLGGQGNHDLDEIEVCSSRCDPQKFAFGMAGFIKKPFHLRRNEVEPSLELQRQVFPFIELAFGEPGTPGYDNWMRVCDGEMTELKDVAMRERPDLVDIENEDCDNEGNEGAKCCVSCTSISNDRKISFLKLLLRLRKVILQDVAAYFSKFPGFKSYVMSHPVFAAPEFLRFRGEMARNLERPDASFSKEISPNFLHALTTVSFQQQEMQTRILTNLEKFTNNYQASFQKLMQSNTAFQDTMLDMMQRYQQQMIDLFEKNSWAKQGYCDSCQCPNCIHWRHFSQSPPIIQQNQIRPMAPTSTHVPAPAYEQGRPWTYQGSSTSPPQPYQFASSSSSRPSPSTSSRQAYYQTHSSIIQTDGQSFHFGPVVQSASTIPATCASRPLNLSHKATDIKEDSDSNFNVSYDLKTATDVWNEQQEFERIKTKDRQQNKKSLFLQANCYKQLNNRKRVAEEVHYRIDRALEEASEKGTALSRDTALQYVLSDLDQIMSANRWSVNQLVNYCRDQAGKRNGKGKDIDRESGSGDGPSTSKAFEDQEAKEEDDC
ncbi:hypothetical protein BCR41DRAFT_204776 [Lobosporangium transversale]|uniref:Ndc10 domain-containing protein n=1 Tax=Lobosporangium transversale TaxID=64571 RepID=A0A1Y2GY45_9FUNG|nr:hypothetical protein BCR41DRAFT_204776 [Lobosporangium transversale]ORZ26734.1 hypothetical protein BCR41DRAFT_204776 [Lobosporangium transversale]|eukprot:XP_021884497.1 hypothetical protein BCR41DRAFT_204776 [Lobosporangium transversale]